MLRYHQVQSIGNTHRNCLQLFTLNYFSFTNYNYVEAQRVRIHKKITNSQLVLIKPAASSTRNVLNTALNQIPDELKRRRLVLSRCHSIFFLWFQTKIFWNLSHQTSYYLRAANVSLHKTEEIFSSTRLRNIYPKMPRSFAFKDKELLAWN